jgi:hypothetical protein
MVDHGATCSVDGAQAEALVEEMVDAASHSKPDEDQAEESQENERKRKREGAIDPSPPQAAEQSETQSADEGGELKSQALEKLDEDEEPEPEAKRRATTDDEEVVADPEQPAETEEGNTFQAPATPLMIGEKVQQAEDQDSYTEAVKVEE